MAKILHTENSPWPGGYSYDGAKGGPVREGVTGFLPGEVRDLPADLAGYLTGTFPDYFLEQADPKPESRPPAHSRVDPPKERALPTLAPEENPPKRRGRPPKVR